MSCYMLYCHHVRLDGTIITLDHDKNTIPGTTFYYCCIHRVYHCIKQKTFHHRRRLQQPLCGECAWLFFRFPEEAERRPGSDMPATVDSPATIVRPPLGEIEDRRARPDGAPSSNRSRGSPESPSSDGASLPVFEAAIHDLSQYVSYNRRSSYLGAWPSRSAESSRRAGGSASARASRGPGVSSPERASVVVRRDPEGDVVMDDSESSSRSIPRSNSRSRPRSGSDAAGPVRTGFGDGDGDGDDDPGTVRVPIRDRKTGLKFIPYAYGEPGVVFGVQPLDFHAKLPDVFMFRYTDFRGQPAVQPTSNEGAMRRYFDGLGAATTATTATGDGGDDSSDEKEDSGLGLGPGHEGGCDSLLRHARWWCCWAQGFRYLEPELRWVLTLVFDFANVMMARQALGGYGAESPVFWRARYYLHDLVGVVEDLAALYEIPNLHVPRLEWFSAS